MYAEREHKYSRRPTLESQISNLMAMGKWMLAVEAARLECSVWQTSHTRDGDNDHGSDSTGSQRRLLWELGWE